MNDDPVAGPVYRRHDITSAQQDPAGAARGTRRRGDDRCCAEHAPAARGLVTLCAARPPGSPGARFFFPVLRPVTG